MGAGRQRACGCWQAAAGAACKRTCSQLPSASWGALPCAAAPSWAASSSSAARASLGTLPGAAAAMPQVSSAARGASWRVSVALGGVALTGVTESGVPALGVPELPSCFMGSGMAEEKPLQAAGGAAAWGWAQKRSLKVNAGGGWPTADAYTQPLEGPHPCLCPLLTSHQVRRRCWAPCPPGRRRSGSSATKSCAPWPCAAWWLLPREPCVHRIRHPKQAACWAGSYA